MNKIKDRKVLIVDDSKLMRFLLKNIVDGMKFFSKIYEAENGREALDLLELNKVDLRSDLISFLYDYIKAKKRP